MINKLIILLIYLINFESETFNYNNNMVIMCLIHFIKN